jgi:hypothetical protein
VERGVGNPNARNNPIRLAAGEPCSELIVVVAIESDAGLGVAGAADNLEPDTIE